MTYPWRVRSFLQETRLTAFRHVSPTPGFGAAPAAGPSALARLDALLAGRDVSGHIALVARPAAFSALVRHVERRTRMLGRPSTSADATQRSDSYRVLGDTLGVSTSDVGAFADTLATRAQGGVLIVAARKSSAWGSAVAVELARLSAEPTRSLLFVTVEPPDVPSTLRPLRNASATCPESERRIVFDALSPDDARSWWDAVVGAEPHFARASGGREPLDFEQLEGWWQSTQVRGRADLNHILAERVAKLSGDARRILGLLVLARQPLARSELSVLAAEPRSVEELAASRLCIFDARDTVGLSHELEMAADAGFDHGSGDHGSLEPARLSPAPDRGDVCRLAEILERRASGDVWSAIGAAELFVHAGEFARGEVVSFAALARTGDACARADLWDRWTECLRAAPINGIANAAAQTNGGIANAAATLWVRSAQVALELGDAARADTLARHALTLSAERAGAPDGSSSQETRFAALMVLARASLTRGDISACLVVAATASAGAHTDGECAEVEALLGETRFLGGDFADAERHAHRAIELAATVSTRLAGRNTLGKLLLAREAWADAERQFTEDALSAVEHGLIDDGLRSQLNRGIAVLSAGRRDEARRAFEAVLLDGERLGRIRAVAFACSNLATLAILERRYADALALSDRAITVRRQLGERLGLVLPITNLAELRVRLGLLDEAEQALRFGLAACGDELPVARLARFARVFALIHLERGDTDRAARELESARAGATSSGDRALLGLCERLAIRIALEDGKVGAAEIALTAARACQHTALGQADLAHSYALVLRASAAPFLDASLAATRLAESADDPELLRECYVTVANAYETDGELALCASFRRRALEQRELVLRSLPIAIRERFLARASCGLTHAVAVEPGVGAALATPTLALVKERASSPRRVLVGQSAPMRALGVACTRIAMTDAHVLVAGPTGSGKELVAEAIHTGSRRAKGPLIKVNCAALVETLLLSELFGHEKGAFTGASARRRGRFELADGGTLFLDEIGDISARTQVALLRVLQDGSFERVGGSTSVHADVRVVCATHRDLRAMVARGEFREDLYYRLCGVVVEVPALKDRVADLDLLAVELIGRAAEQHGIAPKALSPHALRAMQRHPWPGNVREFENAVRIGCLFAQGPAIELSDLADNVESLRYLADSPAPIARSSPPSGLGSGGALSFGGGIGALATTDAVYAEIRGGTGLAEMKKRLEADCIARALADSGGNITRAAVLLGMKRPRLSQLVKEHRLGTLLEDLK
ncbi:MAG: AAA family ATPase [Myxococcales bacterium]|nr:AAA family ATPase [Myxococcales bacterium]